MRAGHPGVSRRERGISVNCLLKVLLSFPCVFFGKSVQVIVALQISVQCLGIHWPSSGKAHLVWRFELCLDLTGYLLCQVSFECEYVMNVSFVAVGPEMFVRRAVDELRGDAHSVAEALDSPLNDPIYVQLTRNFRQ